MSLVQALQTSEKQRVDQAKQRYTELLSQAGTLDAYRELLAGDDPDTLAELEQIMARLGISLAEIEADVKAVAEHRRALGAILSPEQEQAARDDLASINARVRSEIQKAAADLFARMPDHAMQPLFAELLQAMVRYANSLPPAERSAVFQLDRRRDWETRTRTAKNKLDAALIASERARATMARLESAHPRVLAGSLAVS